MDKIGIIGAGAFAEFALNAYREFIPGLRVQAIASRTRSRAERLAKQTGISQVYTDTRELLADPTLSRILIFTPPASHYTLTLQALEANKHVLVDKPVAFTMQQINHLVTLADEKSLRLSTNLVLRFHPFHQRIRDLTRSGELGALRQIITAAGLARYPDDHWYWDPQQSGGFYLNTFSHFLDLYTFITGEAPTTGGATGDVEHGYTLISRYPSGIQATLAISLQLDNPHEFVHTHYIFKHGEIRTTGWMPTKLICQQDGTSPEIKHHPDRELAYRRALADILRGFLGAHTAEPISLETIRASVADPLALAARPLLPDR